MNNDIVFKEGNYYLQEIDLIIPLFPIRKRKKLETYRKQYILE
jgi:hypothetical protein